MKYIDEYRDAGLVKTLAEKVRRVVTRPWTIMEVCGGQTHAIIKFGIDQILPKEITLVHGPGCPVCVTSVEAIDQAVFIAAQPNVIFCSFGDMLRVPGTKKDLLTVKAEGGDVRSVYSPMDAVAIAQKNPERHVVFFAVGFETTAPANASAIHYAQVHQVTNMSFLVSHVLVPPVIEAVVSSKNNHIQGFLAAGHVCTVMGYHQYERLARDYHIPIVVTGFEPLDILQGVLACVTQLEKGETRVENEYARVVRAEGNLLAQEIMKKVFQLSDQKWRGLGVIPDSGLKLADSYNAYDAQVVFDVSHIQAEENPECQAGQILQGLKKSVECPAFGTRCTPEHPLGAPMVSSEGACAAYYKYRKRH